VWAPCAAGSCTCEGSTALFAKCMLFKNARVDQLNVCCLQEGLMALMVASHKGRAEVVALLMKAPSIDFNAVTKVICSAFWILKVALLS
jgi:hypothetical protein